MRQSSQPVFRRLSAQIALGLGVLQALLGVGRAAAPAADPPDRVFTEQIQPILEDHCFTCHGGGIKKGGVDLDAVSRDDRKLWWAVLKNVRSGIMPPASEPQPTLADRQTLERWIKSAAFATDPADPDPGRVTVRRLNRIEYKNTVRDLLGVDFDTNLEFPPDDSGHGFDNIGDVLNLSPLLIEKYLAAAKTIISKAVPTVAKVIPTKVVPGRNFVKAGAQKPGGNGPTILSYYEPATVSSSASVEHDGQYTLTFEISANERYVDGMFDANRCRVILSADGEELVRKEFVRQDGKSFRFEFERDWKSGSHVLTVELQPLTPDEKQVRSLSIRVQSATLTGPKDEKYWVSPAEYVRFFPRDVPDDADARRSYAREILGAFATKAYRRPVDDVDKDRLAGFAMSISSLGGHSFESGVAQAMSAVLASPRFLFREEGIDPLSAGQYPLVDEYALASRLSYFLWSTMPDAELITLADQHQLRANLHAQVERMLADSRSSQFIRHFVGQWLQARDVETVIINGAAVVARERVVDVAAEQGRTRFRELIRKPADQLTDAEKKELEEGRALFRRGRDFELTGELRQAMRRETEMLFDHILRNDQSLLELLDSNYTFLNERLAKHYGIDNVTGDTMRKVDLAADSPRGGILTQGTILTVTSNPDRTSPVKRGLFILDNILGSPPAPPPPNIPSLEEAGKKLGGRIPTLRESMVLHRSEPSCAGCHSRMDPLGLALENFNALGKYRDKERTETIDASGKLISGEAFGEIRALKKILVESHRPEFYGCVTEKLLTYALGRGLESSDVYSVDTIVEQLEKGNGRASALIMGVIDSAPFQKRRRSATVHTADLTDRGATHASDPAQ